MPHYTRLRDLREDSDKTQAELAAYLGTTAQYYGKYEKGERELPFSRAVELAEYYNVSLDYLAGRSNIKAILSDASLGEDEVKLLESFRALTERSKGKVELFVDQLKDSLK